MTDGVKYPDVVLTKTQLNVALVRLAAHENEGAAALYGKLMAGWRTRTMRSAVEIPVSDHERRLIAEVVPEAGRLDICEL